MSEAAVIIPNWNGKIWLKDCLDALRRQTCRDFSVFLIDNGSGDGSVGFVREQYPEVNLICLEENTGFCHAVNEGIRKSTEPFVILLNNDTVPGSGFTGELIRAMESHPDAFACQAKMLRMDEPRKIDDAGDFYCALGWAFARGRGRDRNAFVKSDRIFSACGGACILRRAMLEQTGLLDEAHFAYLEDVDLCWRAALRGWRCYFAPRAQVLHAGSATSGSKYNGFKVRLTSRNSIWIIRKNMPVWQRIINLPFFMAGFGIKMVYFAGKGFGKEYVRGLTEGLMPMKGRNRVAADLRSCLDIQVRLWKGMLLRIGENA